jgi:hypothetical protein
MAEESIAERLKKPRIEDREIEGIGKVRIRRLKVREMLEFAEEKDNQRSVRRMIAMCVVDENDQAVFASDEQVLDLDYIVSKALSHASLEINRLNTASAEKNLQAPPSST